MKNNSTVHGEIYTADSVIARGYDIYDEWNSKRLKSRKIVRIAKRTVALNQQKKSISAYIEALSYIFALDIRIKEKYDGILKRILSYFSWRRETRTLSLLKQMLKVPEDMDVRTAIEVRLEKIREEIGKDEVEDEEDDETRGGKRNNKTQDDAKVKKEEQEKNAEDSEKEITDTEELENSEEPDEELSEKITVEEAMDENVVEIDPEQTLLTTTKAVTHDAATHGNHDQFTQNNVEINSFTEQSESSKDKNTDTKNLYDLLDIPVIIEDKQKESKTEDKPSYLDEVYWEEKLKQYRENDRNNPLDDTKDAKTDEPKSRQNEDNKKPDKDSYLDDKMRKSGEGVPSQNKPDPSQIKNEELKTEEPKINQLNIQPDNPKQIEDIKNDFKDLRVPLQVDIERDYENEARREFSSNMPEIAVRRMYEQQAEIMREQLSIASKELGIDDSVEIIGMPDPIEDDQLIIAPHSK